MPYGILTTYGIGAGRQRVRAAPKRNELRRGEDKSAWTNWGLRPAAYRVGIQPSDPVAVDTGIPARFCRIQANTYAGGIEQPRVMDRYGYHEGHVEHTRPYGQNKGTKT